MANIRERSGKSKGRLRYRSFQSAGNVNPMNYLSNLADAMLVLALGIMAALVLHWNVDLQAQLEKDSSTTPAPVETLDIENLQDQEYLPEDARSVGRVYYDEKSETYYIAYDREDPNEK